MIPTSRVEMAISKDSLLRLPTGAVFHNKSGQAHAEVAVRGDTVFVTATCDSLARQVEYYEELYHNARDALEQSEQLLRQQYKNKTSASPTWLFTAILMFGCIVGVASTIFVTKDKLFKNE